MIGTVVIPSRETECRYIIERLNALGVYETLKGEPLDRQNYYILRTMLAAARAVAQ